MSTTSVTAQEADRPALLMVAGEASADLHGAMVVRELKNRYPDLRIFGIGGPLMIAEGFEPIAESREISVMGLTEVLFSLPRIIGVGRRLLKAAAGANTRAALLLDLPDFNLRLAKFLRRRHIPILYYISPQVWAWRQGRVKAIRKLVDRMLVILPFEQDFYRKHDVPATFVGHPLVEEQHTLPTMSEARAALGLPADGTVVALLPGSRVSEVKRHIADLFAAARLLAAKKEVTFILPVAAPYLRPLLEKALAACDGLRVRFYDGRSQDVILASNVAAVCSGTATLQTALLGRPLVVFYRLSRLTYTVLVRLVKVPAISLVNLIAGKELVKEFIQDDFTPQHLQEELLRLLDDRGAYNSLQQELVALKAHLGEHRASLMVADNCAEYLGN